MNKTITVALITLNDEKILHDSLASIRAQDYPQSKIKINVFDGGSSDRTIEICNQHNAFVYSHPELKDVPHIRVGMALTQHDTDYLLFISADNRLTCSDTITKYVNSIDDSMVGVQSLRYAYSRDDPILSRYFALIGGSDPIVIGLRKADRMPVDSISFPRTVNVDHTEDLWILQYKCGDDIPTYGANGFFFNAQHIRSAYQAQYGLHIDACAELVDRGINRFGIVQSVAISHYIDIGLLNMLKRRIFYSRMYSSSSIHRSYKMIRLKDLHKLIFLVISNSTFIIPFIRSIKGYYVTADVAWFIHPIVSFAYTIGYGISAIKSVINKTS